VPDWNHRAAGPAEGPGFINSFGQWAPQAAAHLGLSEAASTAALATCVARLGIPFLFCGTAMVFNHEPDGPHAVDDARNAADDHGRAKIAAEAAVQHAHPGASIERTGGAGSARTQTLTREDWRHLTAASADRRFSEYSVNPNQTAQKVGLQACDRLIATAQRSPLQRG
jgi:dTDP-4-dehydrorhamnose reductase